MPCLTSVPLAILIGLCLPSLAMAQAISHPNQIRGRIELQATRAEILAELATRPASSNALWYLKADSSGITPVLNHNTSWTVPSRADVSTYEITVEAGEPGIAYGLRLQTYRARGGADLYVFAEALSGPVREEPEADAIVDFVECAGALRVIWQDAFGAPVAVNGGQVRAYRETVPGTGTFATQYQAMDEVPAGATDVLVVVRGDGALYRFEVDYTLGSDPFSDTLTYRWETTARVGCDEIVGASVPPGGGLCTNGDEILLGRITGRFDLLGEEERPVPIRSSAWWWARTLVQASSGPWGNARADLLAGTPANGPFELENLMPSVVEAPPEHYRVAASAVFRGGNRLMELETPRLALQVGNGEDIDLGDAFVMEPIVVSGSILLAGPPRAPAPWGSLLDDLLRVGDPGLDADGDGLPDGLGLGTGVGSYSCVLAFGDGVTTVTGGRVAASFEGALDASGETFMGDHEMILGNVSGASYPWNPRQIVLRLGDTATPEEPSTFQSSTLNIYPPYGAEVTLSPGDHVTVDHHYCMSRLNLAYLATAGTFYSPALGYSSRGTFHGVDFEGHDAHYIAVPSATGTPTTLAEAASQGLLVALLPEGDYSLSPTVHAINPGGGVSTQELLPVSLHVGCRQVISLFPDFLLELDAVPPCADAGFLRVSGRVRGGASVTSIACTVNGGSPITACSGCGVDPTFAMDVPLDAGDSEIVVRAMHADGREASTTGSARHAIEPSAVDRRPGAAPLRVGRDTSGMLRLSWEDVPAATAAAYRGTLSSLWTSRTYDHAGFGACGVSGGATNVTMPAGNVYFVVGGNCAWGDGSLGRDSRGNELPPARNRCP